MSDDILFVIDNFIKDQHLIEAIKGDPEFFPAAMDGTNIGEFNNFYHDGAASCFAPYMFWEGWQKEAPNTLRKQVIEAIWRDASYLPIPESEILGFEYWCRTFNQGQYLNVHVDEDSFAYEDERIFNACLIGCVWYGFTECASGFLELHNNYITGSPKNALESENFLPLSSPLDQRERISYKPNRLVVFNAGRRIHGTTAVQEGTRQVMVVNLWSKSNPPSGLEKNRFFKE